MVGTAGVSPQKGGLRDPHYRSSSHACPEGTAGMHGLAFAGSVASPTLYLAASTSSDSRPIASAR